MCFQVFSGIAALGGAGQRCTVQRGEDLLATLAHDSTGDPDIHLASLEQAIADAGVVVTRQNLGAALGCLQPGRVTILESLTPADTAAVVVREFAHELLHQRGDDRPASKTVRDKWVTFSL